MGMQQPDTAQACCCCALPFKFGNEQAVRFAYQDKLYTAFPVYEQADLAFQRACKKSKFPGLIKPVDFIRRELAFAKTFQRLELAWPQSLQIAF